MVILLLLSLHVGVTLHPLQVYNGVNHDGMAALECDMEFSSDSMRVVVQGSGPLGQFTATVSNFSVKGETSVG